MEHLGKGHVKTEEANLVSKPAKTGKSPEQAFIGLRDVDSFPKVNQCDREVGDDSSDSSRTISATIIPIFRRTQVDEFSSTPGLELVKKADSVTDNLRNSVDHCKGPSTSIPPISIRREIHRVEKVDNQEVVQANTVIAKARRKVKKRVIGDFDDCESWGPHCDAW